MVIGDRWTDDHELRQRAQAEPQTVAPLAAARVDVGLIPGVTMPTAAMIRADWARQVERNYRQKDRNAEIIQRYLSGECLQEIGADCGLTKEGARAVLIRSGVYVPRVARYASQKERVAARQRRLREKGFCIICGQRPATAGPRGGTSYCDRCRAAHRVASRRFHERKRAAA